MDRCTSILPATGARAFLLPEFEPRQLVFQAVAQTAISSSGSAKYGLYGIPEDLSELLIGAYEQKARIYSISWAKRNTSTYDVLSEDLDRFVWDNKNLLVVVAAGNKGRQSFSTTKAIALGSVSSPGTAKNCLTVGASENDRRHEFQYTYGQIWPNSFPYDPFKSCFLLDSVDDIAAFSSRGPCIEAESKISTHRKPDVIAPGTFVLSTRSSLLPEDPEDKIPRRVYPPAKEYYMFESGTSMATPLIAGCAALVREYLAEKHQPQPNEPRIDSEEGPSAALVKAILIHSAVYIDYRFAHPTSHPWADNEQGWGRVNLQEVLNPPESKKVVFIDQRLGLTTGDNDIYTVKILDKSVPLKAHLVYTDLPGDRLVNNLNLTLYSRSGKYYRGNDFDGTLEADSANNVEGVIIQSPEEDTWEIHVVAAETSDTQDYALVISGGGLEIISHERIEQEEQDA